VGRGEHRRDPHDRPRQRAVLVPGLARRPRRPAGSRAAGRFDRNATKPIVGVRIAGKTFERVRGVVTPELTERIDAAMREKYWTQGDLFVRYINHPYYMRLEPE
jgi:hypothetical protein